MASRGNPTCRKEDCSPFDFAVVFEELGRASDQRKFDIIQNVWRPIAILNSRSLKKDAETDDLTLLG